MYYRNNIWHYSNIRRIHYTHTYSVRDQRKRRDWMTTGVATPSTPTLWGWVAWQRRSHLFTDAIMSFRLGAFTVWNRFGGGFAVLTAVSNSVMMYVNGANLFLWFFSVVFELRPGEWGVLFLGGGWSGGDGALRFWRSVTENMCCYLNNGWNK